MKRGIFSFFFLAADKGEMLESTKGDVRYPVRGRLKERCAAGKGHNQHHSTTIRVESAYTVEGHFILSDQHSAPDMVELQRAPAKDAPSPSS